MSMLQQVVFQTDFNKEGVALVVRAADRVEKSGVELEWIFVKAGGTISLPFSRFCMSLDECRILIDDWSKKWKDSRPLIQVYQFVFTAFTKRSLRTLGGHEATSVSDQSLLSLVGGYE